MNNKNLLPLLIVAAVVLMAMKKKKTKKTSVIVPDIGEGTDLPNRPDNFNDHVVDDPFAIDDYWTRGVRSADASQMASASGGNGKLLQVGVFPVVYQGEMLNGVKRRNLGSITTC